MLRTQKTSINIRGLIVLLLVICGLLGIVVEDYYSDVNVLGHLPLALISSHGSLFVRS